MADGRTRVAEDDGADARDEGGGAGHVREDGAVVTGIGFRKGGIFVGVRLPVELAAVHDHAAQRAAVSADELGCGMHHDVGAVLQRPDDDGREGIVHDEHDVVPVGDRSDAFEVGHVGVGVAEGLGVDDLGVGPDGGFERLQVVDVQDGVLDALRGEGVGDEVVAAAVEVVGRDDVVALLQDVLEGVGDGRGAGSDGETRHAAFQCGYALFEDGLGGVGQAAVDVAGVAQAEAVGGVLAVAEDVGGRLVDGDCAGVGCRVRGFLTDVQGQGFYVIVLLAHILCFLICFFCVLHRQAAR